MDKDINKIAEAIAKKIKDNASMEKIETIDNVKEIRKLKQMKYFLNSNSGNRIKIIPKRKKGLFNYRPLHSL